LVDGWPAVWDPLALPSTDGRVRRKGGLPPWDVPAQVLVRFDFVSSSASRRSWSPPPHARRPAGGPRCDRRPRLERAWIGPVVSPCWSGPLPGRNGSPGGRRSGIVFAETGTETPGKRPVGHMPRPPRGMLGRPRHHVEVRGGRGCGPSGPDVVISPYANREPLRTQAAGTSTPSSPGKCGAWAAGPP
jgi:hypothetical protein